MRTIREATLDDARGIAEVHVAGWRWAYEGLLPVEYLEQLSADEREAVWRDGLAMARTGLRCLVATDGDGAIGFVSFGRPAEDPSVPVGDHPRADAGEVYAIYLLPEVAGTGLGRALFTRAVEALRAEGYRQAFLWVLAANERSRRFYEKAGWAWDGTTSTHRFDCAERPVVRYTIDL